MNACVVLRRLTMAALLSGAMAAAPLPALGQVAQVEGPQTAASAWARKMIQTLRTHQMRDEVGSVVALQPLYPDGFPMLDARQRRRIYEWLLRAFGDSALDRYSLVDPARLRDIARALEETGAADWEKRYHEVLESAKARINIICTGASRSVVIELSCSASALKGGVSLGRASVSFSLGWLNEPIALELAVGEFAGAAMRRMRRGGRVGTVKIEDAVSGETRLSRHIAASLEDAVHERMGSFGGTRPVGTGEEAYAVVGEIQVLDRRKAVLRVAMQIGNRRVRLGRVYVLFPEPFAGAGVAAPKVPAPSEVLLPDGYTLADWALLADERLKRGDHVRLLTEASRHMRKYGEMAAVVEVRDRAVTALVEAIRVETRTDARAALESIAGIEAAAGALPLLLGLKARAYRLLGDYGAEAAAHVAWLRAAPQDHAQRREVVLALARAREWLAHHARFAELLGRPFSKDTAEGGVGWTDLHYAAVLDLPGVIGALVDAGMAVDTRLKGSPPRVRFGDDLQGKLATMGHEEFKDWSADGETALMLAARVNAGRAFEYLVERGANVQAKGSQETTPLHHAAWKDAVEAAKYLVGAGADIQAKDNAGETPLHEAALRDAVEAAKYLVGAGADIQAKNNGGETPLHYAAWKDAVEAAKYLVGAGADIRAKDNAGETPLHEAALRDAVEAAKYLVGAGADIQAKGNGGETPLHYAAWKDAVEAAKYLVGAGADIRAKDNGGETPLHEAALRDAVEAAKYLVGAGADIRAKDNGGETPLHYAAWKDAVEAAKYLVGAGADIQAKGNGGETPLHYAALRDAVEAAKYLVGAGADIQAKDNDGETPLHNAAGADAVGAAKYLVGVGADIHAKDDGDRTPLHYAAWKDAVEAAKYLVGAGADIQAKDNAGETPLHEAVAWGMVEAAKYLVGAGADIHAKDDAGMTPLDVARGNGDQKIADSLVVAAGGK